MRASEAFNLIPTVRSRKLNPLPANPHSCQNDGNVSAGRFPPWLHRKLPSGDNLQETGSVIAGARLHTVCEEAKCPNRFECWSRKTATFLIMGKECTRACGFCDIATSKSPPPLDPEEPTRVADSVEKLGLKHVVITMVARDDLEDGGAAHLKNTVETVKNRCPNATIEILTSDFAGNKEAWDISLNARPVIFNYNIETVQRLTPRVRHKATYERTLEFLRYIKGNKRDSNTLVKSGIMVGLGETDEEVYTTITDLKNAGCDIITIGQYLQPNRHKLLVKAFITPEQFDQYAAFGRQIGVAHMYCGPFVRSSYNADTVLDNFKN